jgi:hypothetical protein
MRDIKCNRREAMKVNKVFLAVILAMAVPARATVVYFDTPDPFVDPGETISVSIFSLSETTYIRMDRISDDGGSTASNLYLNPGYDADWIFNEGTIVNSAGILIEGVEGGVGTTGSPNVSGILYSFDYTVSLNMLPGNNITIFADSSNGAVNDVYVLTDGHLIPESLSLTVVPEPSSIGLLSLGLLLLRKIRQRT